MAVVLRFRIPSRRDLEQASEKAMGAALVRAASIIQRRTTRGLDPYHRQFRPYSPKYLRIKTATGRLMKKGVAKPTPDLTVTGQMLNAIQPGRIEAGGRRGWLVMGGQHRLYKFVRLKKPRTLRSGFRQTMSEKKLVDKRDETGRLVQRGTVSMAQFVRWNERLRPFFEIKHRDDIAAIRKTYRDTLTKLTAASTRR